MRTLPLVLALLTLVAVPLASSQTSPLSSGTIRAIGGDGVALGSVSRVATGPGGVTVMSGRVSPLSYGDSEYEVFRKTDSGWERLGGAFDGSILALAVSPGGVVHAAGTFQTVGGSPVSTVARWNGSEWRQMGTGFDGGAVQKLRFAPDGTLHAIYRLPQSGSAYPQRVLRWTGTGWESLGDAMYCSPVPSTNTRICNGLAFAPDGTLYASTPDVRRWDGATWVPVSTVGLSGVNDLVVTADGAVHAFGRFIEWNGVSLNGAARLVGDAWERMDLGLEQGVNAAVLAADGSIWAAGKMGWDRALARWDGSSWAQKEDGAYDLGRALQSLAPLPSGGVVGVGSLTEDGITSRQHRVVREYTEASATDLTHSFDGVISDLSIADDGSVVVGGDFYNTAGPQSYFKARWRDGVWSGFPALGGDVYVLEAGEGETVYVGGLIAQNSQQYGHRVDQLVDGGSVRVGGTVVLYSDPAFTELLRLSDGSLAVTGRFDFFDTLGNEGPGVARHVNGSWHFLGGPMVAGTQGIAQGAGFQSLYALSGHGLYHYTGPASGPNGWEGLGQSDGTTTDVHVGNDGAVYVAGSFSSIGGVTATDIARWKDGVWTALGDGPGWTIREVGTDAQGAPTACGGGVARWNGSAWIQEVEIAPNRIINACDFLPNGDLVFAGDFAEPNGVSSPYIAILESPGFVAADPAPETGDVSLMLAPNPSSGSTAALVSGLTEPGTVTLYDALGRQIAQIEVGRALGRTSVALPTADLSPGVYVVRLVSGGTVTTQRLVVMR